MKYIIIKQQIGSMDDMCRMIPIIFPKDLVHSDVATKIMILLHEMNAEWPAVVVSAGDIVMGSFEVGGISTSLNLKSERMDRHVIKMVDYHNFFSEDYYPNLIQK